MKTFLKNLLPLALLLGISNSAFAAKYDCQASYTADAQSTVVAIPMKKAKSSAGNIVIGGRADEILVAVEINDATGAVKTTLKRHDQTVQTLGAFVQDLSGTNQVFQATLTAESGAIAGPGKFVSVNCIKN
jgi:hypothetical protein